MTLKANRLGITQEEFERLVKSYESPLTSSTKKSGKVIDGVHTSTSDEKEVHKEPTVSNNGDGESYSREELAKKIGMTPEEFDKQVKTYEFPLTGSTQISGKVENGVPLQ